MNTVANLLKKWMITVVKFFDMTYSAICWSILIQSIILLFFSSGEIKTLEQLDREDIDHYELLIEALDQGSPRRSSQTLVKIIVDDVNDEAPKIEVPLNKMIYVAKTGSSLSIGTIIASDRDEKEVLTYQLLGEKFSK